MARHAIVNSENKVVNVIDWEGAEWLPPRNHQVIQSDKADIGDFYDIENKDFIKTSHSMQDSPDWKNQSDIDAVPEKGKEYKVRNKFWECVATWDGEKWINYREYSGYILTIPVQQYQEYKE